MQIHKTLTKLVENYSFTEYLDESSSKSLKNVPYMSTGGPAGMPVFKKFALVRDSVLPMAQIWYIAGPMRAGYLSHVTYLSNQFC